MNLTELNPRQLAGPAAANLEAASRAKLAGWWQRLGREPEYPTDDETAVELCRAIEYAITREELAQFCDVQAFDVVPETRNGSREWNATSIVALACFLECRRAWMPHSELHDSKKTPYERELERFRATGESHELFNDLERYDLRALLLMLVEADARQQREALKVAIEIKLESFDITL